MQLKHYFAKTFTINGLFTTLNALIFIIFSGCTTTPIHSFREPAFAKKRIVANPKTCNVMDYGAKGDGLTKDTLAIQGAIDDCTLAGGGTVLLKSDTSSSRTFISGTIVLKDHITLKIDSTATLKGSLDDEDYPIQIAKIDGKPVSNTQNYLKKALVYAEGATDITLDGGGMLSDSPGTQNSGTIDGSNDGNTNWISAPVSQRPLAVFLRQSNQIIIQGIHVVNSATWSVVAMESTNVLIQNVVVHSDQVTRDGIDIVDSSNVAIKNSQIYSGDDSVCIKSGSSRGVQDVEVSQIEIIHSGANGLKLGVGSVGPMKHIHFHNIAITDAKTSAMSVESVSGSIIDDVTFTDIELKNGGAATPFFLILGRLEKASSPGTFDAGGSIQNISFNNITGTTTASWGSLISGSAQTDTTYIPANITFNNIDISNEGTGAVKVPSDPPEYHGQYPDAGQGWRNLPAYGLYLRHIDGVTLNNVTFHPAAGEQRQPVVIIGQ